MKTTNWECETIINLVETYNGKFMAEVQVTHSISGEHDKYVNFGSNKDIAMNRAIEEAIKDGYHKGISNGTVTYSKWSDYKQLYVTKTTFSY